MNGGGNIFGGLAATDSRTESILAWDMVTAELLLCVLCSVHGTRAIQVLQVHKDHNELAAGWHHVIGVQIHDRIGGGL